MYSLSHKNNPASTPFTTKSTSKFRVQPKLTVNTPDDAYEQEADAMADRVMRMSANETMRQSQPATGLIGKSIQRKCSKCEEEEKKKPIMRKVENGAAGIPVSSSFASSLNDSKGGGSPLPRDTRNFMENAFSADFSSVRVHANNQASELSKGINAKAFTAGNDIYFNEGEYNPTSADGKHLLAHELTHTVQQSSGALSQNSIQRAAYVCDEYRSISQTQYNPGPGLNLTLNGNAITITANMEVYGEAATEIRANQIKSTIERIWNRTFPEGYSVRTTVNIQTQGSTPDDSRTKIRMLNGAGVNVTRPHYWLVGSRTIDLYADSGYNWVPAHEFGHLLGLRDHYSEGVISKLSSQLFNSTRTTTIDEGWEGNLMAVHQGILEKKNLEELIQIGFSPRLECARGHLESPL